MSGARHALAAAFLASVASLVACSGVDKGEIDRKVASTRGTPGSFRTNGVSRVIEKRCGSLDCHGSTARNLRVYSSSGLRLPNDAGVAVGAGDTTLDEITANYQSLMTLEPEATNEVVSNNGDPYSLLIVKKPLELERHKGGQSIRRGDDAERCIVSWLKEDSVNPIDVGACQRASVFPKE